MKTRIWNQVRTTAVLAAALVLAGVTRTHAAEMDTTFTYQGRLMEDGEPMVGIAALAFRLYDSPAAGTQVGLQFNGPEMIVLDGRITLAIDFGIDVFGGDELWLEIEVDGITLSPRQQLSAAPVALSLRGMRTVATSYAFFSGSWNILGGHRDNVIASDIAGGTISGGGASGEANEIGAGSHFATVGGGRSNRAQSFYSTIGGGDFNLIDGTGMATVAGGRTNHARGYSASIGGGNQNHAYGDYATVPGGRLNRAGGENSFAAGRRAVVRNAAESGDADGDEGTFVWADTTDVNFTSTGPDQFLIRAGGGVGIGTNNPQAELDIASQDEVGTITVQPSSAGDVTELVLAEDINADFAMITRYDGVANQLHFLARQSGVETAPLVSINRSSAGNVGIGTTAPGYKLDVNGDAGKPGGGSWSSTSDRRLKKNIHHLEGSLDALLALRGVTFEYKNPHTINELPGERIGMIAQEVEAVFPDWVDVGADGYRRLTYRGFEALTVEAMRELREENDALRAEKDTEIAVLTERINELELLVAQLAATALKEQTR